MNTKIVGESVKKAYEQSRDIHNNVYFFYDDKNEIQSNRR